LQPSIRIRRSSVSPPPEPRSPGSRLELHRSTGVAGGGDEDGDLLDALAASLTTALHYLTLSRRRAAEDTLPAEVARAQERHGLTPREAEVLALMARGSTNREIAATLVISVRTAEHHVAHILRKLAAPDRRAAVRIARGPGVASAPPIPPAPRLALVQHAPAA
jgi:DNA-binding CsgD family transcriptional regulator